MFLNIHLKKNTSKVAHKTHHNLILEWVLESCTHIHTTHGEDTDFYVSSSIAISNCILFWINLFKLSRRLISIRFVYYSIELKQKYVYKQASKQACYEQITDNV